MLATFDCILSCTLITEWRTFCCRYICRCLFDDWSSGRRELWSHSIFIIA